MADLCLKHFPAPLGLYSIVLSRAHGVHDRAGEGRVSGFLEVLIILAAQVFVTVVIANVLTFGLLNCVLGVVVTLRG